MNKAEIIAQIRSKKSFLCIGLDTDIKRIPSFLLDYEDPVFEFNKRIIDATKDLCVAYKPNIAFYEAMGVNGWKSLEKQLIIYQKIFSLLRMLKEETLGILLKNMLKLFFLLTALTQLLLHHIWV